MLNPELSRGAIDQATPHLNPHSPQPAPATVTDALDLLRYELDRLDDLRASLLATLQPVLGAAASSGLETAREASCDLSSLLLSMASRLRDANHELQMTVERVQL